MNQRIGGLFNVTIDGDQYVAEGEYSYTLSGITNEALMASDGSLAGYEGKGIIGEIEGVIYDLGKSTNINKLTSLEGNGIIILNLSNGITIKLSEAAWAGDNKGNTGGKFPVKFIGNCERI